MRFFFESIFETSVSAKSFSSSKVDCGKHPVQQAIIMKKKPILAILGSALLIPTLPVFGKAADADAKIPAVYPVVYENGNYYYHNVLDNEKYPKDPSNNFDLTRWEEAGNGTVGYRVVNGTGVILYDGKLNLVGQLVLLTGSVGVLGLLDARLRKWKEAPGEWVLVVVSSATLAHIAIMGAKKWFEPAAWPGSMPNMSLLAAIAAALALFFYLNAWRRNLKSESSTEIKAQGS